MSLLLDALNKTSGQTKPAEHLTPDPANDQSAEVAGESSALSSASALELTLEEQDCPQPAKSVGEAIENEAEIEVDVDIDEAELTALLDDTDDLSREVQHAATEATFEGETTSAMDRIDELSDEIAGMPSIPSLASAEHLVSDADTTTASSGEHDPTETSTETKNPITADEDATSEINDDSPAIDQEPEISVDDSTGRLTIEAQAVPESLAEEVLQDAPLVQAYSQAQKKRRQILLLIAAVILLVASVVIYKLVLGETSVQANANSFDPISQQVESNIHSSVLLEEVHSDSIPDRLSLPEFSSTADAPVNTVQIEPARAASKDLRRAYTALNQGRLEQAERLYTSLSTTELSKVAALSGLASVAIAKNDTENARAHLQHVLSVDRHNKWAAATLAALAVEEFSVNQYNDSSLSQLKTLRAADPDNHHISYLLGNRFAADGIWTEAQSAYFDAFSLDSQNANYAFNLAIALDHLGKAEQAKIFYLQALQLAETRGADFDVALLRKRLQRGGK